MTMRSCLVVLLMAAMLPGLAHARSWRPAHVVVVIEENHGYERIIGNPDAAFINELAARGALLTNSHGIQHPSQPNYLALFSGSTQGVTDDRPVPGTPLNGPNLGAALIAKGYTFAGYSEGLPAIGSLSPASMRASIIPGPTGNLTILGRTSYRQGSTGALPIFRRPSKLCRLSHSSSPA